MMIVIIAVGSLGDVAPYTGLGLRLKAAGHRVAIATQAAFAGLVRGSGLEFRPLPGDLTADLSSEQLRQFGTSLRSVKATMEIMRSAGADIGDGIMTASEGAEAILAPRMTLVHSYLTARARGIPVLALELFPSVPTGEFVVPSAFGHAGSLRGPVARALGHVDLRLPNPFDAPVRQFCRQLGVPVRSHGAIRREILVGATPILHGYSPALLPRPADWRTGAEVVGTWWPAPAADWQPPAQVADFLDAGPPPVYLGFGSMGTADSERLSGIVSAAVRRAGLRAVVQRGWAGLEVHSDDVLTIDSAPHEWLFERVSAIVHHCGSGTTAAGLRAGKPVIGTPLVVDQPFWARRLVEIGVSPGSIPLRRLDAARLAQLLTDAVTDPSYRTQATRMAALVRAEDGAGRVADVLARHCLAA